MPQARLTVTLPEESWVGATTRANPEATLRVLAVVPTEVGGVGLLDVRATDPAGLVAALADWDDVTVEPIEVGADRALARFETSTPDILRTVRDAGAAPELPVVIREGRARVDVTAPHDRLAELHDRLDAAGLTYEVTHVRDAPTPEGVLTDRQRAILELAVDRGYYETPARCTLADLAGEVGVAKSTVSETLSRAEGHVVAWFLDATR